MLGNWNWNWKIVFNKLKGVNGASRIVLSCRTFLNMPWWYFVIYNCKVLFQSCFSTNNISECYIKFKQTNQSCSHSKISQSINMQLISRPFMKLRKLSKDIKNCETQEKNNESHHMESAWIFPSISHSTGKCNKTHCMGRTWETGTHTFPIVWVLFFYPTPILSYTSSYGKWMGFPINFP